jgi:hypothetical protein
VSSPLLPWAKALAYALFGFAIFGVVVFGGLLLGWPAIPVLAALVGLAFLARWLFRRDHAGRAVLVAVAAQGVAFGGIYVATELEQRRVCDPEERRILETFPHPDGARPGVDGDIDRGGCIVRLHAAGRPSRVVGDYERELRARGWRILGTGFADGAPASGELVADRGGERFYVFWAEEGGGMQLAVSVGD